MITPVELILECAVAPLAILLLVLYVSRRRNLWAGFSTDRIGIWAFFLPVISLIDGLILFLAGAPTLSNPCCERPAIVAFNLPITLAVYEIIALAACAWMLYTREKGARQPYLLSALALSWAGMALGLFVNFPFRGLFSYDPWWWLGPAIPFTLLNVLFWLNAGYLLAALSVLIPLLSRAQARLLAHGSSRLITSAALVGLLAALLIAFTLNPPVGLLSEISFPYPSLGQPVPAPPPYLYAPPGR